jgi:hypothetical protein
MSGWSKPRSGLSFPERDQVLNLQQTGQARGPTLTGAENLPASRYTDLPSTKGENVYT